jgi:hypothetical protein
MNLMTFLEQEGFVKDNGELYQYNEQEVELDKALADWADQNNFAYEIDTDHVFDSPGLDIYCYAFAYWDSYREEIHTNLLTAYCY